MDLSVDYSIVFTRFLFNLVVSQVVWQSDKRSDRLNAKHFD